MGELQFDVAIVGAGMAGAQAALSLRKAGFSGTIGLIGEEPEMPYDRPPLSKGYLQGTTVWERLLIRPAAIWTDKRVDVVMASRVTEIDATQQRLGTANGQSISYGKLIWAAGGKARNLPCEGADAEGVFTVRTRSDVDRIRSQLDHTQNVAVIGGGYIGLEAAASLSALGKKVVVLEAADRVLARVTGRDISSFLNNEHRAQGVRTLLAARVESIEVEDRKVRGVRLADGTRVPAEIVIVGIGIDAEVKPLCAAGASAGNGVRVDRFCRTDLPNVYAIGDCAEHRNIWAQDQWVRLESVQNANDMANVAARHICGELKEYDSLPWFWSDQYDLKLQTIGLFGGADDRLIRGDPRDRKFSVVYLRGGKVICLDCVNSPADFVQGRALIQQEASPLRLDLANPDIALKALR